MGHDIPSRPIARLTKYLVVLELVDNGRNFKFRLVGNALNERFDRDVTGMSISEVYGVDAATSFLASLNKTIALGVPVFEDIRVRGVVADDVRRPEAILLPMMRPDGAATWILIGVFYWQERNKSRSHLLDDPPPRRWRRRCGGLE